MSVTATPSVAEGDESPPHPRSREAIARDAGLIESLVDQLHSEYGVDRDQIRSRATELLAMFAGARVQAFIPILVEKELRQACRTRSRAIALT